MTGGPQFHLENTVLLLFSVAIDGKARNRASEYKYLGVILDASLTWNTAWNT